jgi:hypothetical protein
MSRGIILEGVTGAGKTQVLLALQAHPLFSELLQGGRIFFEPETCGAFLARLKARGVIPIPLYGILRELEQSSSAVQNHYGFVLECFHPTYYARSLNWRLYEAVDQRLYSLNCKIVLLYYARDKIKLRALERVDRQNTNWYDLLIALFGSQEQALQAVDLAQQRRLKCLTLSQLSPLAINTTDMDWPAYADQIAHSWMRGK